MGFNLARLSAVAALATVTLQLSACTVQVRPDPVVVAVPAPHYAPPPPLRYEPPPPPPPSGIYVWRPGHWDWTGDSYAWVRGNYVYRQSGWHRWVHGHWAPNGGSWVWVPGHWA